MNESLAKEESTDPWQSLRAFTDARIALGRTGHSVPLKESLQFRIAHAHARDAVYSSLNITDLTASLGTFNLPVLHLQSEVKTREEYLQRPDRGRKLNQESAAQLAALTLPASDVAIILADGLSAKAVHDHSLLLLNLLIPLLRNSGIQFAPITITEQSRVAIGDEIGSLLNARLSLLLIGERPGLSAPNSLGAYLTYAPTVGLTDESRNCVSNIRPEGLEYRIASQKIFFLISEAIKRKLTGIQLKDQSGLIAD